MGFSDMFDGLLDKAKDLGENVFEEVKEGVRSFNEKDEVKKQVEQGAKENQANAPKPLNNTSVSAPVATVMGNNAMYLFGGAFILIVLLAVLKK